MFGRETYIFSSEKPQLWLLFLFLNTSAAAFGISWSNITSKSVARSFLIYLKTFKETNVAFAVSIILIMNVYMIKN